RSPLACTPQRAPGGHLPIRSTDNAGRKCNFVSTRTIPQTPTAPIPAQPEPVPSVPEREPCRVLPEPDWKWLTQTISLIRAVLRTKENSQWPDFIGNSKAHCDAVRFMGTVRVTEK